MVINCTNINKASNRPPFQLNALNTVRPRHLTLEIKVLVLDRHTNLVGLNQFLRSNHPLLITGSVPDGNTTEKNLQRFASTQNYHIRSHLKMDIDHCRIWLYCLSPLVYFPQTLLNYLAFQSCRF